MTLGFGHGRFIDATALRKAGRIEEFFLEEGIIGEHFSKETMIELAHIIDREREYKEQHGDRYENYWFEDMLAEIRKSRRVLGEEIGFGLVRIQEVLTQEQISKTILWLGHYNRRAVSDVESLRRYGPAAARHAGQLSVLPPDQLEHADQHRFPLRYAVFQGFRNRL